MTHPQRLKLVSPVPHSSDEPAPQIAADASSIGSWLNLLTSLLDLPESERAAVREELESHLRERVRDLIVGGSTEAEASSRAIAELGDAAVLARQFKEAIEPSKWRLIMNVAALSIAGAAILFSGIAVFNTRATAPFPTAQDRKEADALAPAATFEISRSYTDLSGAHSQIDRIIEAVPIGAAGTVDLGESILRFDHSLKSSTPTPPASVRTTAYEPPEDETMARLADLTLTMKGQPTWESFFEFVGKATDLRPIVQWDRFAEMGIQRTGVIKVGTDVSAAAVLVEENQKLQDAVAVRIQDDRIIFAPESLFDRQEQSLVVYNLAPLINQRLAVDHLKPSEIVDEAKSLITQLVYTEQWRDNGGDRAHISRFDAKLFIQAPKRFHTKIRWLMEQLMDGRDLGAIDLAPQPPAASPQPLNRTPAPAAAAALPAEQTQVVYVDGDVAHPGVYAMTRAGDLTLLRCFTAAGGPKDNAGDVVLTRHRDGKQEVVHQLKIAEVMGGNIADPILAAGDRLIVRGNTTLQTK